jgi:hypothetical protein
MHRDGSHTPRRTPRRPERDTGASSRPTARSPRAPETRPPSPNPVISRRDERGLPYPGDWPNPLAGTYRGCF